MIVEITPRYGDGFKILSGNQPFISCDEPLLSLLQRDEVEVLTDGDGSHMPPSLIQSKSNVCPSFKRWPAHTYPYNQRMDVPAVEFHADIGTENLTTPH